MTTCFISYSKADAILAAFIHDQLQAAGLASFMAPMSLPVGSTWSEHIRQKLHESSVVLFLGSREACQSPSALLELGGAWLSGKTIVPIVWNMDPAMLPAWINQRQAVDLRGRTLFDLLPLVHALRAKVQRQQFVGWALLFALAAALVVSAKSA